VENSTGGKERDHVILFKYVDPDAVKKVIGRPGVVSLRFNLPSSYNDPYELFLRPKEPLEAVEERAYYEFFVRDLPMAAVTCFSRRPESVVMWAHYGKQATGVCLGVCEDRLVNEFDVAFVGDVEYSDQPGCVGAYGIRYAVQTRKMRHTLKVLGEASRAAYFSKRSDWQYEEERRVVVPVESVEDAAGVLVASVPCDCITAVITGPHTPEEVCHMCEKWTSEAGVDLLKMHYSKRVFEPYFTSATETFQWVEGKFETVPRTCDSCGEPVGKEAEELCEWCQVTDADRADAGSGNQLVACLKLCVIPGIPLAFEGLSPRGRRVSRGG